MTEDREKKLAALREAVGYLSQTHDSAQEAVGNCSFGENLLSEADLDAFAKIASELESALSGSQSDASELVSKINVAIRNLEAEGEES